ncbi:MAG TPA: CHASE3 domain-containing protein [Gemmatimonadales bacterium]|nr:CHASE3 domain-containing protein [Gemmatimonadales bacterium]
MRVSLERKIVLGFGAATVILVAVGVATFRSTTATIASAGWVAHTLDVRADLEASLATISDAEAGVRAFALTGSPAFLAPFDSAGPALDRLLGRLRSLTADNPDQQRRLDSLAVLVQERLAALDRVAALRRTRGAAAAAHDVEAGFGRQLRGPIRAMIGTMAAAESDLLDQRSADLRTRTRVARMAAWAGMLIALGILGGAAGLIQRDLAGRRRAEVAMRESEERYRLLFDNSPLPAWVFDLESLRFLTVNAAAVAAYGYTPEEFQSLTIRDIRPPEEVPALEARMEGLRHGKSKDGIWRHRRKDGSLLEVEVVSHAVTYAGRPATLVLSHDVTLQRRDEAALRHYAAQLEAANRELDAFAYSVSHDLRAPLRSIDGFSLALLEDYHDQLDPQGRQFLERVRAGTQRMGKLIEDLLTLSLVTRREMHRDHVDLSAIAARIAAELRRDDPERHVEFTIAPGISANGDAHLLESVLANLLGNAWKYTGKRPRARIEFGRQSENGTATYFVRDDGAGFDMAYAGKLFGAFQRLHAAADFDGTGIGLATVQRVVHRHGGKVWADATPERGATFYFTLA